MSDDRFKQARRSLIDKHNQRQQQSDDDDFGDDNTQLVDLHAIQSGAGQATPSFAPPPNMNPSGNFDANVSYNPHEAFDDEATAMFEIPANFSPGQQPVQPTPYSSAPSYTPPASQPAQPASYNPAPISSQPQTSSAPHQESYTPQPYAADDKDENTQFVNLADFANEASYFTPEQQAAGYDGNTQFVDVASLMAGTDAPHAGPAAGAGHGDDIENDPILRQSYHYGPGSIQTGDVTLIFANNALGQGVVLKRVWQGSPQDMSTPLRQRIAQLSALKHPNLIGMNGMVATSTGLWVELDHPGGARLTAVLQEQGPLPKETVIPWIQAAASVLAVAHAQQLAYANLTTDALWIQPDGTVRIEPFDMLRFEERGNLGDFGPQEMHRPADQRQLSPATDIYSLAAVTVATLTGLPLNLARVQSLDKSLKATLVKALSANPNERPQTAEEFSAALTTAPGFDPKSLDIKKVGAVAVLLLLIVGGFMYWQAEQAQAQAQAEYLVKQAELAKKQEREKLQKEQSEKRAQGIAALGKASNKDDENSAAPQDKPNSDNPSSSENAKASALPGPVTNDARLTISTSFQLNPPESNGSERTKSPEKSAKYREKARKFIEEAKTMPDSRLLSTYREALEAITEAILLDPENPENNEVLSDLYAKNIVSEYMNGLRSNVESDVLQGNIASSRRHYRALNVTDHTATSLDFFENAKAVRVEKVERRKKTD